MNASLTLFDIPLKGVSFVSDIDSLKEKHWDWYKTADVRLESLFGESLDDAISLASQVAEMANEESNSGELKNAATELSKKLLKFRDTSLELQKYYTSIRKEKDLNIARSFHVVAEKFYGEVREALNQSGPEIIDNNPVPNDHFYSLEENDQWAKDNGYIKVGVVAYVPTSSSNMIFQLKNPDNSMHNLILVNDSNRYEFISAINEPISKQSSSAPTSNDTSQTSSFDELGSRQNSNAPKSNGRRKVSSPNQSVTKKPAPKRKK